MADKVHHKNSPCTQKRTQGLCSSPQQVGRGRKNKLRDFFLSYSRSFYVTLQTVVRLDTANTAHARSQLPHKFTYQP